MIERYSKYALDNPVSNVLVVTNFYKDACKLMRETHILCGHEVKRQLNSTLTITFKNNSTVFFRTVPLIKKGMMLLGARFDRVVLGPGVYLDEEAIRQIELVRRR